MKYRETDSFIEMTPETLSDLEYLQQTYPHVGVGVKCEGVCVLNDRPVKTYMYDTGSKP